jgi:hypothetical protein
LNVLEVQPTSLHGDRDARPIGRWSGSMWNREKEYRLAELLDHPGLTLALAGKGMERRSVELLLEATVADHDREPCRLDQPIFT